MSEADDLGVSEADLDLQRRAAHHASEAERLLRGRFGIITNYVKAQAHATLAVYYATKARPL